MLSGEYRMFPELKEKPKSKLEKIFSIESNVDALRKILKRIKSRKNESEDGSKTKPM
jgi:hypothetical protein